MTDEQCTFTKEELEDLYICCNGGMHDDHPLEDWKYALQAKIQSMIDNYCTFGIKGKTSDGQSFCANEITIIGTQGGGGGAA